MNNLHDMIDRHAEQAKVANIKDKQHALLLIDALIERYRLEDLFRNRSLAQKRRWANYRKYQVQGESK